MLSSRLTTLTQIALLAILLFHTIFLYRIPCSDFKNANAISTKGTENAKATGTKGTENAKATGIKGLVWLMSFPNSGTTFTLTMTRQVAQVEVAHNFWGGNGDRVDVTPEGPFIERERNDLKSPKYLLTKTHCNFFSAFNPASYKGTMEKFINRCSTARYRTAKGMRESRYNSKALVKRAIHLVRDPFDNLVSRFHHAIKNNRAKDTFGNYCKSLDFNPKISSKKNLNSKVLSFKGKIPCFTDLYLYIQWHNLAIATTNNMKLPTLILHYEKYGTDFEETVLSVMDFLEVQKVEDLHRAEFIGNKTYHDHFTKEQMLAGKEMAMEFASPKTWELIKHYFDSL